MKHFDIILTKHKSYTINRGTFQSLFNQYFIRAWKAQQKETKARDINYAFKLAGQQFILGSNLPLGGLAQHCRDIFMSIFLTNILTVILRYAPMMCAHQIFTKIGQKMNRSTNST
jgi:hypothetical protein